LKHPTNIETEEEEREIWNALSQQSFQKAYAENEPDYANIKVLEPNPRYSL
jgi:hypothetical protein